MSQPEANVRELCSFLGMSYDGNIIEAHHSVEQYAPKGNEDGAIESHHRGLIRPINKGAVEKWRTSLPPEMQMALEPATDGLLTERRYVARSVVRRLPLQMVDVCTRWFAHEIREILYRRALHLFWAARAAIAG